MANATTLSPLKQAFLALEETQAQLEAAERALRAQHEPIAVIGLGCRFPGNAHDPATFWQNLRRGVDAIREVPADRWDADAVYDADQDAPGKTYTRWGGFLDRVDQFDPQFFGISPREATGMDPQQRLLLEVAWEALEHAAQAPDQLSGSRTGVFIGIASADYINLIQQQGDATRFDAYYGSGIAHSIASGRLSYVLGLQGPSLSIDTACSSSLVAVHVACQSLRSGECRMALAGGVHLALSPDNTIAFSKSHMLAPDGHCKTFDARADGFAEGEGAGIVVLKKLSDAIADDDRILAVIRGSALNQDGPSSGLTAPNGPAQEAVIREALANARTKPAEVGYVEAHGTGTSLGDPIEVRALAKVLRDGRAADRPFLLASLKTNIGHLEAAAGVASLIKVVLMVQHGEIPPHLNFQTPNPFIPWSEVPAVIPVTLQPWPAGYERRIAAISAFGFSGTNAHLIVEAAPIGEAKPIEIERPSHVLALSAKNKAALTALVDRFHQHLIEASPAALADVCFTANTGRAQFTHRATFVTRSIDQLREQFTAYLAGESATGVISGEVPTTDRPRITFLFTGQGAQYVEMGRQLYETQPVFRAALDRCDEILRPYLGESLLSVLYPQSAFSNQQHLHRAADAVPVSTINETAFTQPALFAVEYALAELWKSWGVTPSAVMGHSVGEYVAACVAGVFSLEDGLKLIAARGRLMQALPPGGEMAAVFAAETTVAEAIAPFADRVSLAAINGPDNVVISGEGAAVRSVLEQLRARGIKSKALKVSHAFHSPLMDPMLDEFERIAAQVKFATPKIRLISNVTGQAVTTEVTQPAYWRQHVRAAVRFAASIETLHHMGHTIFVEIGPGPTLLGMGQRCMDDDAALWLPSLRPGQDDWLTILGSLSALIVRGARVDWRGFDEPYARRKLALPSYPFQRERYWLAAAPRRMAIDSRTPALHPLLGRRLRSALSDVQFESELGTATSTLLNDHRVFETALLPATAYLEAFTAAMQNVLTTDACWLEDVTIHAGLVVPEGATRITQVIVKPDGLGAVSMQFFSSGDAETGWQLHASAVGRVDQAAPMTTLLRTEIQSRCIEQVTADAHYQQLRDHGMVFGPSLHGVRHIWRRSSEALGEIQLPDGAESEAVAYRIHPALLDACIQILEAAVPNPAETYLPIGVENFRLYRRPGTHVWSHALIRPNQPANHATLTADIRVFDDDGQLVAEAIGMQFRRADRSAVRGKAATTEFADWLYEVEWQPQPRSDSSCLPTPDALIDQVQPLVASFGIQHGMPIYAELLPPLEALGLAYVIDAFQQLGWKPRVGDRVSTLILSRQLGVIDSYRRLLDRLLEILSEGHYLQRAADEWEVTRLFDDTATSTQPAELLERFPNSAELKLLARCGPQLAHALRGEVDALQLLFPGGSFDAAEQLYHVSPSARTYNALVAEAIATALAQLPAGRTLRILEIGAGTGGTTASVLPRLPADRGESTRVEYTYTDISPLFTAKAQQRFEAYPFVRYQTLDLEQDPLAQGLAPHHFDIVLAANVIHATADLRRTLNRVKQVLSPDGLLMMIEVNRPQRWIDLTFGLTDGWWKFTDEDLRPAYPLLSRAQWSQLLMEVGFTPVAALPLHAEDDAAFSVQSIIIARGPLSIAPQPAGRWLIFADAGGVGDRLADKLSAQGAHCIMIEHGAVYQQLAPNRWQIDPAQPADAARVLRDAIGAEACPGVLQLWNLDVPASDAATSAQLMLSTGSALHLTQALIKSGWPARGVPRLWFVTRHAQAIQQDRESLAIVQAPIWGLGKTIALEYPELHCTRIDLDGTGDDGEALIRELLNETEDQVAYRNGQRYVARLARRISTDKDAAPTRLEITARGTLDNLALAPLVRRAPGPAEVEIAVQATGLNFKDVMNVLGMYPGDPGLLGGECAGTIVAIGDGVARGDGVTDLQIGDDVIVLVGGCFGSFVTASVNLVARKPAGLSFEAAATIAIPFITAHFTLNHLGRLQAGERVLIHAAAGGVGLAAVQLAQRAGAEIFATAGSPEKRAYLKSLGVAHVMDSRSLDFAAEIMTLTNGQGVDVILNSLAGEFIPKSLAVLGDRGRFLEIGKSGLLDEKQAAQLGRGREYYVVDWGVTAQHDPALIRSMLLEIVALIETGELKPLPYRAFPIDQALGAFRYMAQARHIGKLVIVQPQIDVIVRADATYLITGGLGGLGLITAQWLVERGAQHLVLMGRGEPSAAAQQTVAQLIERGAAIETWQGDVSQFDDVRRVLAHIDRQGPPLRGIIHSAGVLDDGALAQQDWSRFVNVLQPKVDGAWHLHQLTCDQPLDFFVLYSSLASVLGSAGQGNHAAANMLLDVLAHWRRAQGLPALSINWGAWSEVGAAVAHGVDQRIAAQGVGTIAPEQGMRVLEHLLRTQAIQTGVMPIDWGKFLQHYTAGGVPPFLSAMRAAALQPSISPSPSIVIDRQPAASPESDWLKRITAAPAAKQRGLLIDYVRTQAARVLALDAGKIGERVPLSDLGLDSLMAVELRNLLGTGLALKRKLPATLVFDYPTLEALADYVAREVLPSTVEKPAPPTEAPARVEPAGKANTIETIEELSDEEVDRLLAEKMGQSPFSGGMSR
ncbi:MAG: SDR family NAD(P)-dependent oxidoreductase [Chloroflexi bacterium]|nr:SDR family NAD(P)-dependent oxidoreductase [Chloroflexota bacterium]